MSTSCSCSFSSILIACLVRFAFTKHILMVPFYDKLKKVNRKAGSLESMTGILHGSVLLHGGLGLTLET